MAAVGVVWLGQPCPVCDLPLAVAPVTHPLVRTDGGTIHLPITVRVVCPCGWTPPPTSGV